MLEDHKAVVRRHLDEAINGHRPEVWDEVMAPDFLLHHPSVRPGRDNYAAAVGVLWAAFPDLHVEILDVVAEGERVAIRYVERGTQRGDFFGLPPSGKTYQKHGFALYRLDNGRLAECWFQEDDAGFQRQLLG